MRIDLRFNGISGAAQADLRQTVAELAERRLKPAIAGFGEERIALAGRLERSYRREAYRVALRLRLPGGVLSADEEGDSVLPALREAFDELARQVERHLAAVRREGDWRRTERRARLRALKHGLQPERRDALESLSARIARHLPGLMTFAAEELAAMAERGIAAADLIEARELIDEVVLDALSRHGEAPADDQAFLAWLYRLLVDRLDSLASAPAEAAEGLEALPPEPGVDETFEERLIAALDAAEAAPPPPPGLTALPTAWRRAWRLVRLVGLSPQQAASVLRVEAAEVEAYLAAATPVLGAHTAQRGTSPIRS